MNHKKRILSAENKLRLIVQYLDELVEETDGEHQESTQYHEKTARDLYDIIFDEKKGSDVIKEQILIHNIKKQKENFRIYLALRQKAIKQGAYGPIDWSIDNKE